MTSEEKTVITANKAHENYEATIQARANIQGNFLVLGQLLKSNRDDSLWKFLDHDSFESYLGSPEFGFKRSTAYKLIALVELYIDKLNVPANRLVAVGTSKLDKIAKVVESDVEGWLSKAEHLSVSSISEELGRGPGKTSFSPPSKNPTLGQCINGCSEPAQKMHFPITRGAGGDEVKDWWIPACGKCHQEYHADPKEWTWKYRRNWARWFYSHINRGE
jgi:hypothetical protein